jgi:cobalamin biosynthesis protein CobT
MKTGGFSITSRLNIPQHYREKENHMIRDQELTGLAMTLGRDSQIKITVGGDNSYCTSNGSHINIARMPATPLGRMLMTGLVFHEVGHKNFTRGGKADGFLGDMMNVIEDIRVDTETIKARPGTCFNLEAVTTHYMNKGSLQPDNIGHALLGKMMAYGFGRILSHSAILPLEKVCDEMMDDAFGEEFIEDVEKIITNIPKLRSTRETRVMANELVELLVQQQQKKHKKNKPQQQNSRTGKNGQQGQGNSAEQGSCKKPSANGTDQHKADDSSGYGGNAAGSGGGVRPTPEEIEELLNNKSGYGDLSALIQSELNTMAECIPPAVRDGIPMLPVMGRLDASHGRLNEVDALSASSRMRAQMLGMLQSVKRRPVSYGVSGRKLAAGRLVKLATGDPRIFRRRVEKVEVNTAVVVLLDLSGSMSSRYEIANAAAFALHTTLFGLKGVAVCSLEFSGKKRDPEVNVLVDFGRKPLSESFNHHPFDGTPTHNAIWGARALLLQRPEPRKIMLLITDGCPDDSSETMAATQRTMKDGVEIAAIGIMNSSVRHYWDNHTIINSIQELPTAMFGIMESLLTTRK